MGKLVLRWIDVQLSCLFFSSLAIRRAEADDIKMIHGVSFYELVVVLAMDG